MSDKLLPVYLLFTDNFPKEYRFKSNELFKVFEVKDDNSAFEIFKRFNNGETYTEIAKDMRNRGIKTRTGLEFNYYTIVDFLKQEKYAGYTITLKRYVCDSLTHKAKRNKGEVAKYKIDGTHPAIISK